MCHQNKLEKKKINKVKQEAHQNSVLNRKCIQQNYQNKILNTHREGKSIYFSHSFDSYFYAKHAHTHEYVHKTHTIYQNLMHLRVHVRYFTILICLQYEVKRKICHNELIGANGKRHMLPLFAR